MNLLLLFLENNIPIVIVVIIIVGVFAYFFIESINNSDREFEEKQKALKQAEKEKLDSLKQAEKDYRESLAKLKENPTNADLKQQTLELGRIYSSLTREGKSVTIYDEMMLMNDINAACAGATTQTASLEHRLEQLENLKVKQLISEEEYNARRQQIISEI